MRAVAYFAKTVGRTAVARALASSEDAGRFWEEWLLEAARVQRRQIKTNRACFASPLGELTTAVIADTLRRDAADVAAPGAFNMADVVRAAVVEDDLSLFFRANLSAMLARPVEFCAAITPESMELSRRADFGDTFAAVYTGRSPACLVCHNSAWSITDGSSVETDRFWPAPGKLEVAVYGASGGLGEATANAAFRFNGVFSRSTLPQPDEADWWPADAATPVTPWGMDPACGAFLPEAQATTDLLADAAFLAGPMDLGSIWTVARRFGRGADSLAAGGRSWGDGEAVASEEALAYLLALRLADGVWDQAFGAPLTLSHGVARNPDQQLALVDLADQLAGGWSLRELLVAIAIHPWFNPRPPAERCSLEEAYELPAIFDPFSAEEEAPLRRGNGPGDMTNRMHGRRFLHALTAALGWPPPVRYPKTPVEVGWQEAAGVFHSDAIPGSRALSLQNSLALEMNVGACTDQRDPDSVFSDWVRRLLVTAFGTPGATLRDAVAALEDRLVVGSVFREGEGAAALFGVGSLDTPMTSVPGSGTSRALRRLCGIILMGPFFTLQGPVPSELPPEPTLVVPGMERAGFCETIAAWLAEAGVAAEAGACAE